MNIHLYLCVRMRDEHKELAIRQKAIEMIVRDGFDGLSMQKLAKAAGVSPATIYIYFKDRDDLILQLWLSEMDKMVKAILKDFDPDASFEDGLRQQWMNRARFLMENPDSMHFMEQIKYSPYHTLAQQKMDPLFMDMMKKFTCNAIDRKELIKLPFEVYWSVAFAPMYQLVKAHISGKMFQSHATKFVLDDAIMNQTLALVLKALKP